MFERTDKVPAWLRKPVHKKEVVASDKGWIVKETCELLVRVPNLLSKIAEYFAIPAVVAEKIEDTSIPEIAKVEVKLDPGLPNPDSNITPSMQEQVNTSLLSENDKPEDSSKTVAPPTDNLSINNEASLENQPKRRGRKPKNKTQEA